MFSLFGLTLYLFLEFLRPEVLFPDLNFPLMFWVAVGTLILWLTEMIVAGWRWQSFYPTRFFCLFIAACMVSSVFNRGSADKVLNDFQDLAKLLCIYLVVVESVDTERRLKAVYWAMVGLILVLAVEGIGYSLGYPLHGFRFDGQGRLEYSGIFRDSNDLGQIYAIGWTVVLFHLVNGQGAAKKIADAVLLGLFAWAMLLTSSRGTMLAAIIGVFLAGRQRFGVWKPAVFALLLFITMNRLGIGRMDLFSSGETSAEDRVIAWSQGWYMLRSHPILGVGPHNFHEYHPLAPHSTLVQVGAETGIVGLFFWVGLFYSSLRQTIVNLIPVHYSRRELLTAREPGYRELQMQAAVLVCFVSSLFLTRAYMLPLYLLLALALAAGRLQAETQAESQQLHEADSEPSLFPIGWASIKQIAVAQIACIVYWRVMARKFIDGI
jgi:O-antigen ligase